MKRLRVYLSSTFEDLKEYRAAVFAALERAGLDVARMEGYTAADERPVDLCLRDVAASDVYVGIYAWRYGYVPPAHHENPAGKSISELEYRQAEARGLRKLVFLAHPDTKVQWPAKFKDEETGEGDHGARLTTFRTEIGTEKITSMFRTPDELATLVLAALMRTGLSGRPYNIPLQRPGVVPRPALINAVHTAIVGQGGAPGANTLVFGGGGFGKTTLALDACHTPEIVKSFPDGMLWVALGERPDVGKTLSDLYVAIVGEPPAATGVAAIAEAVAKRLEKRRCLVVVDDVWRSDDLVPFLALDGPRLLVTSRIRNLLDRFAPSGWAEVPVDEMDAVEAASLLGRGLVLDSASRDLIASFARNLGCWPLLLQLANARLLEENKTRKASRSPSSASLRCIGAKVFLGSIGANPLRATPRLRDQWRWGSRSLTSWCQGSRRAPPSSRYSRTMSRFRSACSPISGLWTNSMPKRTRSGRSTTSVSSYGIANGAR